MKKLQIEDKLRLSLLFNVVLTVLFLFLGCMGIYLYNLSLENYSKYADLVSSYDNDLMLVGEDYNNKILSLNEIHNAQEEYYYNLYTDTINKQAEKIETLETNIAEVVTEYKDLVTNSRSILLDNKYLARTNIQLTNTISELSDKVNVYEEYEYAMFDDIGKRTDITYENIKLFEELLDGKVCDNLHLYLSWIMIESSGHNDDRSTKSTAAGLPQFLEGTGRNVWKNLLGREEQYNHYEIVENPENSIPMMVAYVDDLCMNYNGNLDKVIDFYRGLHDTPYLNKFNKYLSYSGNSIQSIGEEVKKNYNEYISTKSDT